MKKPVKFTVAINPAWKKQLEVVKREVKKLNKIKAYTITSK
jgi:hypothetical protein